MMPLDLGSTATLKRIHIDLWVEWTGPIPLQRMLLQRSGNWITKQILNWARASSKWGRGALSPLYLPGPRNSDIPLVAVVFLLCRMERFLDPSGSGGYLAFDHWINVRIL
jgi:hypothetical protein